MLRNGSYLENLLNNQNLYHDSEYTLTNIYYRTPNRLIIIKSIEIC
jgi:hypothetical protein